MVPGLLTASTAEELDKAEAEAEAAGGGSAIALPPGAPLWAQALIGLRVNAEDAAMMDTSGL